MAKEARSIRKNNKKLHGKFSKSSKSNSSMNPDRKVDGNTSGKGNSLRSKSTINRLKMYKQRMPD